MPSRLVDELQRRYSLETGGGPLRAILLHGSAASPRQDAFSDLDLLLITVETAPAFHILWHIDQTPCDLHIIGLPELLSLTQKDLPSNNNFGLRAFATGTLLLDANPSIAAHQREAIARWQAGPAVPSLAGIQAIRQAAIHTDLFLAKCSARSARDPLWREIQLARSGIFLAQLVDSYCRLNRLWSNAFWILRHESGPEYQPIVDGIRRFLTPDPETKVNTLRHLCGLIVTLADKRSRR